MLFPSRILWYYLCLMGSCVFARTMEKEANETVQVHSGPWDAETREHPAMKWLEDYTVNCIDSRAFDKPYSVWHSDDFSLLKTDGTEIKGGKEAWASVGELFAPFTSHLHQPMYACCTETKNGYEMLAQAWIFANFPGVASAEEQKHKDAQGKEWDMKVSRCRVLVMSFTLTCYATGPRCLPLRAREEFREGLSYAEVRAHERQ